MKTLACTLLALVCAAPLCAQRYLLKDGHVLGQSEVVIKNGSLVRTLATSGGGAAEVSYPFSQVVRIDWPEPDAIDEAKTLLASGKAAEAMEKITPTYLFFAPFPSVPGSWWSNAAIIRARALLAQKKITDAESAAREVIAAGADADDVQAAQLILAEVQLKLNKPDIADAMLDAILQKHASAEIAARAVILRGDIAYENKQFDKALEFYLQVPVFYGSLDELLPAALLGSARAYKAYGDNNHAERAYLDLINSYPDSAEAATAKAESKL